MSIFDKVRGWVDHHFGSNEGVELIAKQLSSGVERIHAFCRRNGEFYEFQGTGVQLSGGGNHRVYDIDFRKLNPSGFDKPNRVSEFTRLTPDTWEYKDLARLDNSYFNELLKPVEFHEVNVVVEQLRKIASRLKPGQLYQLGHYGISMDLFTPNGYRLYLGKGNEIHIPATMIGNPRFFTYEDLNKQFDRANVLVLDETKIARKHRNDKDIKRWYELKQVPSVNDRSVLRFTHRNTAHAEVFYYDLQIIVDAKNQKGKPFYLTEIVKAAVKDLKHQHPPASWHLELDYNNIYIEVDGEAATPIETYILKQNHYPARQDSHPILIDDHPYVTTNIRYGNGPHWSITTYEEWCIETAKEAANQKAGKS